MAESPGIAVVVAVAGIAAAAAEEHSRKNVLGECVIAEVAADRKLHTGWAEIDHAEAQSRGWHCWVERQGWEIRFELEGQETRFGGSGCLLR